MAGVGAPHQCPLEVAQSLLVQCYENYADVCNSDDLQQ